MRVLSVSTAGRSVCVMRGRELNPTGHDRATVLEPAPGARSRPGDAAGAYPPAPTRCSHSSIRLPSGSRR